MTHSCTLCKNVLQLNLIEDGYYCVSCISPIFPNLSAYYLITNDDQILSEEIVVALDNIGYVIYHNYNLQTTEIDAFDLENSEEICDRIKFPILNHKSPDQIIKKWKQIQLFQ